MGSALNLLVKFVLHPGDFSMVWSRGGPCDGKSCFVVGRITCRRLVGWVERRGRALLCAASPRNGDYVLNKRAGTVSWATTHPTWRPRAPPSLPIRWWRRGRLS